MPIVVLILGSLAAVASQPDEDSPRQLARVFSKSVRPILREHCVGCHGGKKREAKLDLETYSSVASVSRDLRRWEMIRHKLEAGEMPPAEAAKQPTTQQRQLVVDWIRKWRRHVARRNAGDPGPVLARRLSNSEYDYTIRDLVGVDIQPTREFPIDPANQEGFDNSGESLTMSPALLKKYLAAARFVADHLVLKPNGFVFAPHLAVTDTDRDKYCVKRIIDFYQRQPTDYADYFEAAWRFRQRDALGQPAATLDDFAAGSGVSPKYLKILWAILEDTKHELGPLAGLQKMWRDIPAPNSPSPTQARGVCERMRDYVLRERKQLASNVGRVAVSGIARGSQPMVLWINRQLAANRRRVGRDKVPDDKRLKESLELFCQTFPDAFYVSERGRMLLEEPSRNKGRLLSAGFHLMSGYFRDDQPLCQLILDQQAQQEIDELWRELDFITFAPTRQYKDFIFFERAEPPRFMQGVEFDFARSEDKDVACEAKIQRLARLYLDKARSRGGRGEAIKAIEDYFANISQQIRWAEQARLAAQPSHLAALQDFAERAYRRPLLPSERQELPAFYRLLRKDHELSHEEAIRDVVVSVLMSPFFCYRIEIPRAGASAQPVSDYELASRLSYFLWSSMPDRELLAHAAAGTLHQPETLVAQARRMIEDPRVKGLATEFGGNWLGFRRFEQHNSVDRQRFTSFTDQLRLAMFQEPICFFVDLARQDGSVLDFLYADHTFVNRDLARHYGMPPPKGLDRDESWGRVDEASRYGRGGLLPMSVFLTQNSPGLRTSPVKRGYWVVRQLLGEQIPPPPPEVPELPKDEAQLGDLTLRQILAKHREAKSCATCHARFDSFGLVFEGYGPIGERRQRDLGGKPVDARAMFPVATSRDEKSPSGGSGDERELSGVDGLRRYLRDHRQQDFIDNLSRKLLGYALGRSLRPSDDETIEAMRSRLAAENHRFSILIVTIVTSPQFLNKRGRDYDADD